MAKPDPEIYNALTDAVYQVQQHLYLLGANDEDDETTETTVDAKADTARRAIRKCWCSAQLLTIRSIR
jgi:hypothetical protein